MRLAEIGGGLDVVRDAAFDTLGLLSSPATNLLVFVESADWADKAAQQENVACVLTTRELAARLPERIGVAAAPNPRAVFYALHNRLVDEGFYARYVATVIAASARVHPRSWVAERGVRIGERCVVEPNATIFEGSILEDDVIVRAGAVIGGEGFQIAEVDGALVPVRHGGGVKLERGSEVQHNTVVDRAVFGELTTIGQDTKIDNLVHIAHNVRLGKR
ncbi:MAG TPA: hypothetical protein VIF62_24330, partial [Labilithrix sp.]